MTDKKHSSKKKNLFVVVDAPSEYPERDERQSYIQLFSTPIAVGLIDKDV